MEFLSLFFVLVYVIMIYQRGGKNYYMYIHSTSAMGSMWHKVNF